MNAWQMAQQIKHKLQAVRWPGGSAEVVFGTRGVTVAAGGVPNEEQLPKGFPFALVLIGSGNIDDSHPELTEQQFSVVVACNVAGDATGEHAIIGGSTSDLGHSAGRGVAEVSERARAAVQNLTGADGARVLLTSTSTGAPVNLGRGKHLGMEELILTAVCTSQPHYAAPQELTYDSTQWTWEGDHCSARYDFIQYRLAGRAGFVPPATIEEADSVVYTGTETVSTHERITGWSYTIFADYGSRGRWEASSEAVVGAVKKSDATTVRLFGRRDASFTRSTDVTPYSTWDAVGEVLTFDGVASANGGSGAWLDFLVLVDGYASLDPLLLFVFDRYPVRSTVRDNHRIQLHRNDLKHLVGWRLSRIAIPLNKGYVTAGDDDLYAFSSNSPSYPPDYPERSAYVCEPSATKLYGVLVAGADQPSHDPPIASSEWTVRLLYERD